MHGDTALETVRFDVPVPGRPHHAGQHLPNGFGKEAPESRYLVEAPRRPWPQPSPPSCDVAVWPTAKGRRPGGLQDFRPSALKE